MRTILRLSRLFLTRRTAGLVLLFMIQFITMLVLLYEISIINHAREVNQAMQKSGVQAIAYSTPFEPLKTDLVPSELQEYKVDAVLYGVRPDYKLNAQNDPKVGSIILYDPLMHHYFPFATEPSVEEILEREVEQGTIMAIVPHGTPYKVGDHFPLTISGTTYQVEVAAIHHQESKFLSFFDTPDLEANNLYGDDQPCLLINDHSGILIDQPMYHHEILPVKYYIMNPGVEMSTISQFKAYLHDVGESSFGFQRSSDAEQQEHLQYMIHRRLTYPTILLVICSLMTINITVLRVQQFRRRSSIYRILGVNSKQVILGFTSVTIIVTGIAVLIGSLLYRYIYKHKPAIFFARMNTSLGPEVYLLAASILFTIACIATIFASIIMPKGRTIAVSGRNE